MPGRKGIVGRNFTPDEFDAYCHTLRWNAWRPSFIVLHNTAVPSLAQPSEWLNPTAHSQSSGILLRYTGMEVRSTFVHRR